MSVVQTFVDEQPVCQIHTFVQGCAFRERDFRSIFAQDALLRCRDMQRMGACNASPLAAETAWRIRQLPKKLTLLFKGMSTCMLKSPRCSSVAWITDPSKGLGMHLNEHLPAAKPKVL